MSPSDSVPVSLRREHAQQRAAENRADIAIAWAEVGQATVDLEAKAHRAVDWTRTLAGIAAVIGGIVALRRLMTRGRAGPATRGRAGPAMRALAVTSVLRHALPTALRLYLRRY